MEDTAAALQALERDIDAGLTPTSIEEVASRLSVLTDGLKHRIPVLFLDTRLFRIRRLQKLPSLLTDLGAPPLGVAPAGRLNEPGQSVLYLADSPDTAFAEARSEAGEYCLSEWRVNVPKLAVANGGLPDALLSEAFPIGDAATIPAGREDNNQVIRIFRKIFTMLAGNDGGMYRWSIACGQACGFSHLIERTSQHEADGNTHWKGRYPLAGIAYPSTRANRPSVNYAFNDFGITKLRFDHVQWVRRFEDGSFTSLDYANSLDKDGKIEWTNRPARFTLRSSEAARVVKIEENAWRFETVDGSLPWFS